MPENVTIVSNTSTEISFNCNVGFNLTSGDLHIECVNNTWEGDIPTCSSKSRNLTCICIFVGNEEMGVDVVVGFTTTYPISATNIMSLDPTHGDVDSIKHYMIKVNYCFYAVSFNCSHETHT